MVRGTTPTHTFYTDVDLSDATVLYVTYKQKRETIVERSLNEVDLYSDRIVIHLTQKETLRFFQNIDVHIQIRAGFSDDTRIASEIIEVDVREILKDGEI